MRRYAEEIFSPLPPQALYSAIAAVSRWPEWDDALAAAVLHGPVFHGTKFTLQAKSGRSRLMLIETADPAERFADVATMIFARQRTIRAFTATEYGTKFTTVIEVWGPLAFFWDRVAVRRHAERLRSLTDRFLNFAAAFA